MHVSSRSHKYRRKSIGYISLLTLIIIVVGTFLPSRVIPVTESAAALPSDLSLQTSADDHGKMFFGDSLLQVILTDTATDGNNNHTDTTISPSVEVRDNTGNLLASPTVAVRDTSDGSQRFEFFLKPANSTLTPQDPGTKSAADLAANMFTVGNGADVNIGEDLGERFTIKIVYKTMSDTITYDSTPSAISTDRDAYGLDNFLFLIIDDQDGNADPTHRDVIITPASGTSNGFITMSGVDSFDPRVCTETSENSAEFECPYRIGTPGLPSDLTVSDISDNNVVITAKDVKKYMNNDGFSPTMIEITDSSAANDPANQKTGETSVSITIDDSDGVLNDPGSISTSSELKLTLTDTDRDLSSKLRDAIGSSSANFVPGNPLVDLNLGSSNATGVLVWIDSAGGDIEAIPMMETEDNSGVFVTDLANDELQVSFLAAGETATPNNGVLEFTSANTDKDIIVAYIDPAPDDPTQKLTASFAKSLTRTPGAVSVPSSVGIHADFALTLNDPDLNNDARSKDSYKLVLKDDHSAADSNLLKTSPNSEFELLRGSNSISDGTADALYATLQLVINGEPANFTSGGLIYTLTESGPNRGVFNATLDMGDIIADLKGANATFDVADGDTFEFVYNDYMEDTPTDSHAALKIGVSPPPTDTNPPVVSITSAIDGFGEAISGGGNTTSDSITFEFSANDTEGAIDHFDCFLISSESVNSTTPCSSPIAYSSLTAGLYQFAVNATDSSGNQGIATFEFTVIQAPKAPMVDDLIDHIHSLDISQSLKNSLSAPLKQASALLNDDNPRNDNAVCGKIGAFTNLVNAKTGKDLSSEQSEDLINQANTLMTNLGC